jgi:hypothetical protein
MKETPIQVDVSYPIQLCRSNNEIGFGVLTLLSLDSGSMRGECSLYFVCSQSESFQDWNLSIVRWRPIGNIVPNSVQVKLR